MPTSTEILEGLTWIANAHWPLAVLWHVVIGTALVAVASGSWAPTRRGGAVLLVAPLISVGALAFGAGNPFNGTVFLVAATVLAIFGLNLPQEHLRRGPGWAFAVGVAALAYGLLYPHFLDGPAWLYVVAAPTGLVPCATLAAVLGLGLMAGGLQSRAWSLTAGIVGLFYGLFGVLRLGVWLDIGLILAAGAMIALAVRIPRRAYVRWHAPA